MVKIKSKHTKADTEHSKKEGNPYKALESYQEADQNVFFGREDETEKLFKLVKLNSLTVVFGKSGIGKTSLLNAGLFPRLREEDFMPIKIRLNFTENTPPLKEQIRSAFEAGLIQNEIDKSKIEIESQIEDIPLSPLSRDETLWAYFHRITHFKLAEEKEKKIVTPVLVFDQFEEIFTVGKQHKEKDRIIDELYWLLEDQLPPEVRERVFKNDREAKRLSYSKVKPHFKVIISLREDYLPHLNDLKTRIPFIEKALFRVDYLTGKQARDVISNPEGGFKNKNTIKSILRLFYTKEESGQKDLPEEKLEIEPAFLSLLCHQMFERQMVESITIKELSILLEDYYDSKMNEYPPKVHEFIETKLLTEGGFRTPRYLEEKHPLRKHINKLIEQRILRKSHDGHKEYVEIVHDFLTSIIEEKRSRRIQKRKNKAIFYLGVVAFALLFITVFAFYQKFRADKQYNIAQANRLTTEALLKSSSDNTKAIRILEEAIKKTEGYSEERLFKILSEIGYSSYHRPFYRTIILLKPNDVIYSAAFSADSQHILTAHEDGTAHIRDQKGNSLFKLKGHENRIMSAVFSPDESMILTASWDKTVKLWSREGKMFWERKHDGIVSNASFSPDGKRILTASFDYTARLLDLQGNQVQIFKHNSKVSSASFSPDGTRIQTTSWDNTARIWNDKGEVLAVFEHESSILPAVFSPDGKLILTAGSDGTVKLWNFENKKLKTSIKHEGILSTIAFSPDGDLILTASEHGAVKLWDLKGNRRAHFDRHQQKIQSATFSPDGRFLFTSSYGEIAVLWDLQSNILVNLRHNEQVSSAEFSPDGNFIITTSRDGIVTLWDDNGKFLTSFKYDGIIFAASFSPKMDFILTADKEGIIKLWDPKGNCIDTLKRDWETLTSAVLSKDGSKILTVSDSNDVTLWSLQGGILKEIIPINQEDIASAVFSPDGSRILIACKTGMIVVRDLSGRILHELNLAIKDRELLSATFSPAGRRILIIQSDRVAKILDLSGVSLVDFRHDQEIYTATFSPDGKQVLTASLDRKAKLWDLEGNLLATFEHEGEVVSAAFSPDGKRIVTASRDATAKVWMTPHSILKWLKNSKISKLTEDDKKELKTPPYGN
jgi:WD40 repeat protein